MGKRDNSSMLQVTAGRVENIRLGEICKTNNSRMSYRQVENNLNNSSCVTVFPQLKTADCSRIKGLKEDLMYFRGMLEQMVTQKTEKTDFYASILKSCHSTQDKNYHKMHKKYLDLLNKTQAHEAKLHLRVLEGELAMLTKNNKQQH